MAASTPGVFSVQQFTDLGGPLVGGRLYTYTYGTTSLKVAYTDINSAIPHTYTSDGLGGQYIALNSRGELPAPLYLVTGSYDLALKRSDGSTVWTRRADPTSDTFLAQTGAGQIGFLYSLSYSVGTVGRWLKDLATSSGPTFIGWLRTATSSVLTTLNTWLNWQEISAFEFMTAAEIADYQASAGLVDHSVALQAWITACQARDLVGRLPPGGGRVGTTLTVPTGVNLRGHGISSLLKGWGVSVFQITGDFVSIEDLGLFGYTNAGAADPRTQDAITSNGVLATKRNYCTLTDLYLQGWNRCIDFQYMDGSVVDNVTTVNSDYGIRYHGQCVNNSVNNSRLVVNGGVASIITTKNGADQGEGLMVTNSLLASGQYGFSSDGFLAVEFDNTIVDLTTASGFNLYSVIGFSYDGPWVYSAGKCFNFVDPGVATNINATVRCSMMTTSGPDSCFYVGPNNQGWSVDGHVILTNAAGGYPLRLEGAAGMVGSVRAQSANSNPDIYVNASDIRISQQAILSKGVQWNVSPVRTVASGATTTLSNPTGAQIEFYTITGNTNCTALNDPSTWTGKIVTLKFSGTPTWTDGGNLKLSANFVATADDTLTLASDGTNWFEIARSAN